VCHPAAGSALVLVTGQVRLNTAGMLLASDHFDVVVTDCGDGTWEWEIYCGGKPLRIIKHAVRLCREAYVSWRRDRAGTMRYWKVLLAVHLDTDIEQIEIVPNQTTFPLNQKN
jgi:hypothetical protein